MKFFIFTASDAREEASFDTCWFTGAGDLDACNGMTRDGASGYYVTVGSPWVVGCFMGTPDASFRKAPP